MKTLTYKILRINVSDLCRNIESNIDIKLGNIDNDNPTHTNGYIMFGDEILSINIYEDIDIQELNDSFFVKAEEIDNIAIAIDSYIKNNYELE